MILAQNQRYVWEILALTLVLLVVWNYWLPLIAIASPFVYSLGSGDFALFYRAGVLWLAHQNPYVLNGATTDFVYPPSSLPLYGLLSLLDFRLASEIWTVLYLAVFVAAAALLGSTLESGRRRIYVLIATLIFITSYPLLYLIELGQSDLLIAGIAILGLAFNRMGHKAASAFDLSVATLLKGPAALFLIYFVVFERDVRYLVLFLGSSILLVGASLLVVPVGLYEYYLTRVLPVLATSASSGRFQVTMSGVQSIPALFAVAGFSSITPIVSIAAFLIFGIFAFSLGTWKAEVKMKGRILGDGMFLMNVLVMLLFVSRTETYSYVWVILPLALWLSALVMEKVNPLFLALICSAIFMFNSINSLKIFGSQSPPVLQGPFAIFGNLILTSTLIAMYLKPGSMGGEGRHSAFE